MLHAIHVHLRNIFYSIPRLLISGGMYSSSSLVWRILLYLQGLSLGNGWLREEGQRYCVVVSGLR